MTGPAEADPTTLPRRDVVRMGAAAMATMLCPAAASATIREARSLLRQRIISDNDFSGDPDGLFQLAHHLLCPSVQLPLVVGTHLRTGDPWNRSPRSATDAAERARALLGFMGRDATGVVAGSETALASRTAWRRSPATAAIVQEAMRTDTKVPLFYAAGAGLTEIALAWLAEPRIASRLKLVWVGGNEHAGLALPPPGPAETEFNFSLDPVAAQIVFNESDIEIWQVPRDAYRQLLFGWDELDLLAAESPLARFLKAQLDALFDDLANVVPGGGLPAGETYVLGDSALVTLTALQTTIQPDASSSRYTVLPTPTLLPSGAYRPNPGGRPMRVYTEIDAGMTIRDMVAKFRSTRIGRPG